MGEEKVGMELGLRFMVVLQQIGGRYLVDSHSLSVLGGKIRDGNGEREGICGRCFLGGKAKQAFHLTVKKVCQASMNTTFLSESYDRRSQLGLLKLAHAGPT